MSRAPDAGERVKLWRTKEERETLENHADLFAILKTTEKLERAWTQDAISAADYELACTKLIAQFKTLWGTLRDTVPDVAEFARQYNMACSFALKRLIESGVPATVEHGRGANPGGGGGSARSVSDTTAAFITCLDNLRLSMTAVDQVSIGRYLSERPPALLNWLLSTCTLQCRQFDVTPELSNLLSAMHRVPALSPSFEGKQRVKTWLSRLNAKPAHYELTQDEARQLEHDISTSFSEFNDCLESL